MLSELPDEHPISSEPGLTSGARPLPHFSAPERWTFLDLLFFGVFALLAFVFTGTVALAGYRMLMPVIGWHTAPRVMGQNTFFLLGVEAVFYALILAYVYFLVVVHYRQGFWEGISWGPMTGRTIVRFAAVGIGMTIVIESIPIFLPDTTKFPLERMFSSAGASYALAAFAIAIAPFMEELVFRGVLFSIFEARVGLIFAVVATAVLFAALHIPEYRGAWDHLFLIFVVGLVLSVTRGLTRSLAPSVIIHITYNSCLMILLFLASSHFRMVQGWRT
ncbi:MAG: lysostaphin resistance A-like protein [Terriglobia bacterium]